MLVKKPVSVYFSAVSNGNMNVYRNGRLFSERPFETGLFKVNLPLTGEYTFDGPAEKIRVTDLVKAKNYIELPPPERNREFGLDAVLRDNKSESPARIYTAKKTIVVNDKFMEFPGEIRYFILLHELGHFYYKSEWKCDLFAAYWYLREGFNPSQGFDAIAGVLHTNSDKENINERNEDRIKRIYNILKKQH